MTDNPRAGYSRRDGGRGAERSAAPWRRLGARNCFSSSTVANGNQTLFEGQRLAYQRDGRAGKGAGANDLP